MRRPSGDETWTSVLPSAIMALAADPTNGAIVYAGTRRGVLKSEDAGMSWRDSSSGLATVFTAALAIDPIDHSTVYAGTIGEGVFKTVDAGKTWSRSGKELQLTAVRCLAVDPSSPHRVYAGTDGGVYVSINGGVSWMSAGGPRSVVYALAMDSKNPARIFAGTAASLFLKEKDGTVWRRSVGPAGSATVTSLGFQGSRLAVGTMGDGILFEPIGPAH